LAFALPLAADIQLSRALVLNATKPSTQPLIVERWLGPARTPARSLWAEKTGAQLKPKADNVPVDGPEVTLTLNAASRVVSGEPKGVSAQRALSCGATIWMRTLVAFGERSGGR
jgi:hypothetical protein